MAAQMGQIVHFDLGDRAVNMFVYVYPKLPDIRLGFCIRQPVVAAVLILAGNLTVVTSAASGYSITKTLDIVKPPHQSASLKGSRLFPDCNCD